MHALFCSMPKLLPARSVALRRPRILKANSPFYDHFMTTPIDKRDLPWIVLIGASFILGLVFSWERWGDPLVDCGREMNQPLRLARREMLYSEVRHIYGPLSPYINAMLYRLFGPAPTVLYADGIFMALAIVALIYWLARQLMGRAASTVAALSVVWLCAFKAAGNYMLPYSYSALHGCALGLAALALAARTRSGKRSSPRVTSARKGRSAPSGNWLSQTRGAFC